MPNLVRNFHRILFLLLVFSNCVLFEPKISTVPDAYVREEVMNEEQKTATKVLKQKVIQFKNEVTQQRKLNSLTNQSIQISKAKVAKHSADRDLSRDKEKYFLLKDDPTQAKRYLEDSQNHEMERAKEETRMNVWIQKEKEDIAYLEAKEAALAETIAELELVRSEIAVKFQESQGKTPEDKDYIKKEEYESQYADRKSEARRKVSELERIRTEAPKLPKVNLEDSFYEGK
ncbi:MAG: hypothetical protein O9301_11755 [Leptospira sp.]|nr:hypothetical protein [Leptospira sp.]